MKEIKDIEQLFRDKLTNHSSEVNPDLWSQVAAQIPSSGSWLSSLSLSSKIIIGAAGVGASILVGSLLVQPEKTVHQKVTSATNETRKADEKIENAEKDVILTKNENLAPISSSSQHTVENRYWVPKTSDNQDIILLDPIDLPVDLPISDQKEYVETPVVEHKKIEEPQVIEHYVKEDFVQKQTPEKGQATVWENLPNIFSPNRDGVNDEFFFEVKNVSDFSITILSADNEIVFQSVDPNFKWNGELKDGTMVKPGQYLYYVVGINANKERIAKSSSLTVQY